MKRLTTNLAIWLMAAGLAAFAVVYTLFGQHTTIEIASAMLLGGCIVIALTWLPTTLVGISKGTRGGAEVLAFGICSMGLFGATRQIWTQVYRYLGQPEGMLEHWTYPLILWALFWSTFVVIVAPGTQDGEIPITNKIYLLAATGIGALVAGIAIGMSLAQLSP